MATINYNLEFLYDTADTLENSNPLLAKGQLGIEIDSKLFKLGDGLKRWNELTYAIIEDRQSVWVGLSTQIGNVLRRSQVDNGIFYDGDKGLLTKLNQGVNLAGNSANGGSLTGAIFNAEQFDDDRAMLIIGWVTRALVNALGPKFESLRAYQLPNTPGLTVEDVMNEKISAAIGAVQIDPAVVISDTSTVSNKTWSSSFINSTITSRISTAINNLVGAAPEDLNTIYELAAALSNNSDTLGAIVSEMATALRSNPQTLTQAQQIQSRANIDAQEQSRIKFLTAASGAGSYPDLENDVVDSQYYVLQMTGVNGFAAVISNAGTRPQIGERSRILPQKF